MKLLTSILGLFAVLFGLLATMTDAAPFSTITTCTTTTITPEPSASLTTTTTLPPSTSLTLTTTTITIPSSTTTSYTTVTAPVPTGTTVPEYGQCGGLGYAGPTTCESPLVCACTSAWWCQCQSATFKEFQLEDHIPSTGLQDEASQVMHPSSVNSTYWPPGLPGTMAPASEHPQAS
ncbi:glycosylhydrolase family 18-1 [Diaporthe eres]|uniref:CBM1 domain-containing protein n=1 Tax=Diaporthe vaccinii TaxID=105482 RepID=A0ABR4ELJ1_9PEZI|nr:glycosylhydrolase family 18-1 [Diaporthe eres]